MGKTFLKIAFYSKKLNHWCVWWCGRRLLGENVDDKHKHANVENQTRAKEKNGAPVRPVDHGAECPKDPRRYHPHLMIARAKVAQVFALENALIWV
jgi:hypothetical protein